MLKIYVSCQLPESLLDKYVDEVKLLDLLQQESVPLRVNNVSEWKIRAEN